MSHIEKPAPEIVRSAQDLWDTLRPMMLEKGLDIEQRLNAWSAVERQKLASSGARTDFDELCEAGCAPQVLALIIALLRYSPKLTGLGTVVLGDPDKREKAFRSLERASTALEEIFGETLTLEDEKVRADFLRIGRVPPSRLVSEIRFYAKLLAFAEWLPAELQLNSIVELAKYILAGYVERATGRFCDRNVSALIGDTVGPADHNEVAQRMWRYRNYERLKVNFQGFPELLFDLTFVVTRQT
jgi:hypothetical protein